MRSQILKLSGFFFGYSKTTQSSPVSKVWTAIGCGLFSGLGKALGGVFGGGGNAELQNQRVIAALGRPTATPSNGNSGAKKCANGFRNKSSVFIKIEAKKAPR